MSWLITPSFTQWTPALISTALWLDAGDSSTIFTLDSGGVTPVNGGSIGRWEDKSLTNGVKNNRHVIQATDASRPVYQTGGLNNKPVVAFNGSSQFLASSSPAPGLNDNRWIAVICNLSSTSSVRIQKGTSDANEDLGFVLNSGSTYYDVGAGSGPYINVAGSVTLANKIFLCSNVRESGISAMSLRIDGSIVPLTTTGGSNAPNSSSSVWQIGRRVASYQSQPIAEILAGEGALDTLLSQKIEGYLAHKWDLTANLPSNHPYKVNPPAP